MWTRLDDALMDHRKVFAAGDAIGNGKYGKNGPVIALGFYALALMWSNKQLQDGFLPMAVIKKFSSYVDNPQHIADAFVKAGLFEKTEGGYLIHDYTDYNHTASEVRKKRRDDRDRKAESRS
jgi:hypothetical protein